LRAPATTQLAEAKGVDAVDPSLGPPGKDRGAGADEVTISVPGLYWGLHRMLHSMFGDAAEAAKADALAKKFGPLRDKFRATLTASLAVSTSPVEKGANPATRNP